MNLILSQTLNYHLYLFFDINVNLYLKQVERAIQTILQTDSPRKGVTLEYSCV